MKISEIMGARELLETWQAWRTGEARQSEARFRRRVAGIVIAGMVAVAMLATGVRAQDQEAMPTPPEMQARTRQTTAQQRWVPPSNLGLDNQGHVAASAVQVEEALQKDPGLMVELKRLIAKEATDQGQIVVDADLTDDAVYQRIRTDVEFRSKATILLQRYGYLVPQVNPDSAQGKEEALVLSQRAQWLAQIQGEELANQRQEQKDRIKQAAQAAAQACNPVLNPACIGTPGPAQAPGAPGVPYGPGQVPPYGPGFQQGVPGVPGGILEQAGNQGYDLSQLGNNATLGGESLSPDQQLALQDGSELGLGGANGAGAGVDALGGGQGQGLGGNGNALSELGGGGSAAGALSPGTAALLNPTLAGIPADQMSALNGGFSPGYTATNGFGFQPSGAYAQPGYYQPSGGYLNFQPTRMEQPNLAFQADPYAEVPSIYDMYLQAQPHPQKPQRFGENIFLTGFANARFLPMDLPVGPDYIIGPGDSLAVDLWGGVSQRLIRVVDSSGRITLPDVGPVSVSGRSLGDVQETLQGLLRTQFRDVSADVSLSRLRTVRVYVVGDVQRPGAYDISSLSTPLNALFMAGGPTSQGSLRVLRHMRGNRLAQEVDTYDLLLHGVRTDVKRMEDGDTLLVSPIGPQITVEGLVRRPAIYELHGETNLAEALALAGGMLPTAAVRHIEVQRLVAHEKKTMLNLDIPDGADAAKVTAEMEAFKVQDGDSIRLFPIAPFNQDAVYLEGHVLRPGRYSYRDGLKVTDLIGSYKDMLPEPAPHYAEIIRLNPPDYRPTVESFDLAAVLANKAAAPALQPMDTVQVFSRYDFETPPTISVLGDVRNPGIYRTTGQIHLADAVHVAGGLAADASLTDAQVYRFMPNGEMKIMSVDLKAALAGDPVNNLILEARDRVIVHTNMGQVDPATVYVQGEVAKPGRYLLSSNMTVADLVRVSGGMRRSADSESADLTRLAADSPGGPVSGEHLQVPLSAALAGDSSANFSLKEGDVLTIRQVAGWNNLGAYISVKGEVNHPGTYGIKPGERLSSILIRAGGFTAQAYPFGAILERDEVRQLEDKSRSSLVERIKADQAQLRLDTENQTNDRGAKEVAYRQWDQTLQNLLANPPTGRVSIRISVNIKQWANRAWDVEVRAGDRLIIPKKPSYVSITGQVYNPTAISFRPGKSAAWYLRQAGGPTVTAYRKAIFVIRADGTVIGGKGTLWSGSSLNQQLEPGDTIVVPEKALGQGVKYQDVLLIAQTIASIASTAVISAVYF
jgi:protein involved in polysaccharide export with SLBB domain